MEWQAYLDREQDRFVGELIDLVKIPSISAKPEHADDVAAAGEWVASKLKSIGIENVAVMPTAGHPVVYGDWLHAPEGSPTIMIYGHFDVQPAEPMELWTKPPFEPEIRDGLLYGRGASDDKGGMMVPIVAVEALMATTGRLPVNVKFFFEGQEEIASPDLPPFVEENRERLAADMIFSADGLQWDADTPQLIMGLKGIVSLEVVVTGPDADQHSGLRGAGIANPAMGLAQVLATMKSPDGRVTVEGFYDDVEPLSEQDRQAIARVPFDEATFLAETGAPAAVGEPGFSTLERLWARPTLDVNGLTSGWQGAGTKTIVPAVASAKITCRLVADQSPERIFDLIRDHVERVLPEGLRAEVNKLPGRGDPLLVPHGHNATAVAATVLEEVYGKTPYQTRVGGSIPVMNTLLEVLGVHPVMFGFQHGDEKMHSPNEFFRLSAFRRGQTAYVRLLESLAV
ncbi:dipeptidase [Hoeflea poritis]|uniref:Dipeptidase n=1 Tax=Hoeflea poritis TaxID=2993659 RepID=A0ABT4VKD2_9HYPH|nr:dipeptidase [Hoeflea poritis]MDA4845179.1 dipeptidase [Hoeflea poritis]